MKSEKKEFQKAEVEVIRFEKNDIITTSFSGPHAEVPDPMEEVEGEW